MRGLVLKAIVLLLAGAMSTSAFADPILNPTDFASLGTANISGATVANTDALTLGGFTGVLDQGFAVFDFADFTIAAGADLKATGTNGLAILSGDSIDILGTLDVTALHSGTQLVAVNNFEFTGELLQGNGSITVTVGTIPGGSGLGTGVSPITGTVVPADGNSPPPILTVGGSDGSPPPVLTVAVPEAPSALLLISSLILWWFLRNARFLRRY